MLTPEDAVIIYDAVRDGVFWGSFWGAIVFHIFFFGGIIVIGNYISKKYKDKISDAITSFKTMFGGK